MSRMWVVMLEGEDEANISWPNWWGVREGPGQEYPKPSSVYEEFDDSGSVCKDHSKWKELISAYPKGKRAWCYVYIIYLLRYICEGAADLIYFSKMLKFYHIELSSMMNIKTWSVLVDIIRF
jgi:hypothetical protein